MSGTTSTSPHESPDGRSSQITPLPSTDSSEIAVASSVSKMAILTRKLEELNMVQYLADFIEAGFDEWEILCDIRESDLDALNVKLGHRRRLQRRIASERGLASNGIIPSERDPRRRPSPEPSSTTERSDGRPHVRKRKYVRHPKPDVNAPKRALSAYATFANDQRRLHDYSTWTFPDIAKQIGELWRSLGSDEKDRYHAQAAVAKEEYAKQMALYKTTDAYRQYQEYLTGWKVNQARKSASGKAVAAAAGDRGYEKQGMDEGSETSSPPAGAMMLDGERSILNDWTASVASRSASPIDGGGHRWLPPIESTSDYSPISPTSSTASMRPGARLDAALLGPPPPPHHPHHRHPLHPPPTTQPGSSSGWQGVWSSSWQDMPPMASYPPTSSAGDLRSNGSPWPSGMNGHPTTTTTFGGSGAPNSGSSSFNLWSNRHPGS